MAQYPGAVKSFTTPNVGDVIQPAHVNDLQDEVNAIEAGLLQGTAPLNSSNSTHVNLSVTGGSTLTTLNVSGASTFAGAMNLTSGQIAFPAVQNASAGANTLDDYEEGTWTPSVGGSATYAVQNGTYTKIGRLVSFQVNLTISAIGTGSQGVISGLPFTAAGVQAAAQVGYWANAAGAFIFLGALVQGTTITLSGTASAAATVTFPPVVLGNNTDIYISGSYFV